MSEQAHTAMSYDSSLRNSAITLAVAGGIESGLQLAMPIILVRFLDATAFGQYRFLWLLSGTALAIAPAFMPQSLFYFLPRAEPEKKRLYIGNVLTFLIAAGCIVGVVTSGLNPFLPKMATSLFVQTHGISALFLGLWIVASLLDVLPTADGRARWQANSTVGLAVCRTLLLAGAAFIFCSIGWVVFALLLVATAKIAVLAYYILTKDDKISWQAAAMKRQLAYSLPFAAGNALFLLRMQADQWVVASMLSPALFATFSIAGIFSPVATLIRQPVYNAMMPRLNSAHARGDLVEIGRLIAKSNGATSLLLVPIAGALFSMAPQVAQIIFTSRYPHVAPIMQVYLIGMMINVFAVGHVLSALDKGRFAAINSACGLVLSIFLSILGVMYWGMIGAAIGSVLTLALGELWALRVVADTLGIRISQLLAWSALWPTALGTCIAMEGAAIVGNIGGEPVFLMLLAKTVTYVALFAPCFFLAGGRKQLGLLIGWRRRQAK